MSAFKPDGDIHEVSVRPRERAAPTGIRNGLPEPKRYVYGAAAARREAQIAARLAAIHARIEDRKQ